MAARSPSSRPVRPARRTSRRSASVPARLPPDPTSPHSWHTLRIHTPPDVLKPEKPPTKGDLPQSRGTTFAHERVATPTSTPANTGAARYRGQPTDGSPSDR